MRSLNPAVSDWRGKRVWIVGASTGIGEALALDLASHGARLLLSARNPERLQALASQMPDAGVAVMDVCDAVRWPEIAGNAWAEEGGPDMVVFNAGTYEPLRAWELAPENIRRTLEINLLGVMNGVAAVLPRMLAAGRGHIVIVGSVAGYRGLPQALVYGPSKAALINFAESLYMDLAPKGVAVSLVSPGFVATPLTAGNRFHMPALITAQQAAAAILRGLSLGEFEIHFPKRFSLLLKCLRLLPARLYFNLAGRLVR